MARRYDPTTGKYYTDEPAKKYDPTTGKFYTDIPYASAYDPTSKVMYKPDIPKASGGLERDKYGRPVLPRFTTPIQYDKDTKYIKPPANLRERIRASLSAEERALYDLTHTTEIVEWRPVAVATFPNTPAITPGRRIRRNKPAVEKGNSKITDAFEPPKMSSVNAPNLKADSDDLNFLGRMIENGQVTDIETLSYYYEAAKLKDRGISYDDFYAYFPESTKAELATGVSKHIDYNENPESYQAVMSGMTDEQLEVFIEKGNKAVDPFSDDTRYSNYDSFGRQKLYDDYEGVLLDAAFAQSILALRNSEKRIQNEYFGSDGLGGKAANEVSRAEHKIKVHNEYVYGKYYYDFNTHSNILVEEGAQAKGVRAMGEYLKEYHPNLLKNITAYFAENNIDASDAAAMNALYDYSDLPPFKELRDAQQAFIDDYEKKTGYRIALTDDELNRKDAEFSACLNDKLIADLTALETEMSEKIASTSENIIKSGNSYFDNLNSFSERRAGNMVSDTKDPSQVNSFVDVLKNYIANNTLSNLAYIFDLRGSDGVPSIIRASAANFYKEQPLLGFIDDEKIDTAFSSVTDSQIMGIVYDLMEDKLGLKPETARSIFNDVISYDGAYQHKKAGDDLSELFIDRFLDPLATGKLDIVANNVFANFAETADVVNTYTVKLGVGMINPEAFGKGVTRDDVISAISAPTYADARTGVYEPSGKPLANLDYDVFGNGEPHIVNFLLEMLDPSFIMGLVALPFKIASGVKVGSKLASEFATEFADPKYLRAFKRSVVWQVSHAANLEEIAIAGGKKALKTANDFNLFDVFATASSYATRKVNPATAKAMKPIAEEAFARFKTIVPEGISKGVSATEVNKFMQEALGVRRQIEILEGVNTIRYITDAADELFVKTALAGTGIGLPLYLVGKYGVGKLAGVIGSRVYNGWNKYVRKNDELARDVYTELSAIGNAELAKIIGGATPIYGREGSKYARAYYDMAEADVFKFNIENDLRALNQLVESNKHFYSDILNAFREYLKPLMTKWDGKGDVILYYTKYLMSDEVTAMLARNSRGLDVEVMRRSLPSYLVEIQKKARRQEQLLELIPQLQNNVQTLRLKESQLRGMTSIPADSMDALQELIPVMPKTLSNKKLLWSEVRSLNDEWRKLDDEYEYIVHGEPSKFTLDDIATRREEILQAVAYRAPRIKAAGAVPDRAVEAYDKWLNSFKRFSNDADQAASESAKWSDLLAQYNRELEALKINIRPTTRLDDDIMKGVASGSSVESVISKHSKEISLANSAQSEHMLKSTIDSRAVDVLAKSGLSDIKMLDDSFIDVLKNIPEMKGIKRISDMADTLAGLNKKLSRLNQVDDAISTLDSYERTYTALCDELTTDDTTAFISTGLYAGHDMPDVAASFKQLRDTLLSPKLRQASFSLRKSAMDIDTQQFNMYLKVNEGFAYQRINHESGWYDFALRMSGDSPEVSTLKNTLNDSIKSLDVLQNTVGLTAEQAAHLENLKYLRGQVSLTRATANYYNSAQQVFDGITGSYSFNRKVNPDHISNIFWSSAQDMQRRSPLDFHNDPIGTTTRLLDETERRINNANRVPYKDFELKNMSTRYKKDPDFMRWFDSKHSGTLKDARKYLSSTDLTDPEASTFWIAAMHDYEVLNSYGASGKRFVYDVRTTGDATGISDVVAISLRDLDNPADVKTFRLRATSQKPTASHLIKSYDSDIQNMNKLLDPENGYADNKALVRAFLDEIHSRAGRSPVQLIGYEGEFFNKAQLNYIVRDPLFDTKAGVDVAQLMQDKHGYFKFTAAQRSDMAALGSAYQRTIVDRITPDSDMRLLYGATPEIAESALKASDYIRTTENADSILYPLGEDLLRLHDKMSAAFDELGAANRGLRNTLITKELFENGYSDSLFTTDVVPVRAAEFFNPQKVQDYLKLHGSIDPTQARQIQLIVSAADGFAHSIHRTGLIDQLDMPTIVRAVQSGNTNSAYSFIVKYLDPDIPPLQSFSMLYQLGRKDPVIFNMLPDEMQAIIEKPWLLLDSGVHDLAFGYVNKNFDSSVGLDDFDYKTRLRELRESEDVIMTHRRTIASDSPFANNPQLVAAEALFGPTRRLNDMAQDIAREAGGFSASRSAFTEIQSRLFDEESTFNLKQILNIGYDESGVLNNPAQLASFMINKAHSDFITFSLDGADEIVQKQAARLMRDSSILEKHGMKAIIENNDFYIVLTKAPSFTHTKADTVVKLGDYVVDAFDNNYFKQFDMSASELASAHPEFADQLAKVYELANRVRDARGSMKDVISSDEILAMRANLPDSVRKYMLPDSEIAFIESASGPVFNYVNVGSFSSRRTLQPLLTEQYAQRMTNTTRYLAYHTEAKSKAVQLFFDDGLTMRLNSDMFKNMFPGNSRQRYAQMRSYFAAHPEYSIAVLTARKDGTPFVRRIKPAHWKSIREAERLDAVILENDVLSYVSRAVNSKEMSNKAAKFLRSYMLAHKMGQLTNWGTWLRNIFDNGIKFMAASHSDPVTMLRYHGESLAEYIAFQGINKKIMKFAGDAPSVSRAFHDAADMFWNNTSGLKMGRDQFEDLSKLLRSDSFTNVFDDPYIRNSKGMSKAAAFAERATHAAFSPMSFPESVSRLAQYRYLRDTGVDNLAAKQTVKQTFFGPASISGAYNFGTALRDMVFPYFNFMVNNLKFWIDMLDENPRVFIHLSNIMQLNFSTQPIDAQEAAESPWKLRQRNSLALPLDLIPGIPHELTGTYLKLNPSVLDMFNFFIDPWSFAKGNMFTPIQSLVNDAESSITGRPAYSSVPSFLASSEFADDEETAAKLSKLLQLVPGASVLANRADQYEKIKKRTGVEYLFPSLFTTPYNANIVDDYRSTEAFPSGSRLIFHKNNRGETTHIEQIPVPDKKDKESENDPFMVKKYSDVTSIQADGTEVVTARRMDLIDTRTGKTVYTYYSEPGKQRGESNDNLFRDRDGNPVGYGEYYDNGDGTYTYIAKSFDGQNILYNVTREKEKLEIGDGVLSLYIKRETDGELVSVTTYARGAATSITYNDGGALVKALVAADGTEISRTKITTTPEGDKRYVTYDVSGNITGDTTYHNENLEWNTEKIDGVTFMRGYNESGEIVKEMRYSEFQKEVRPGLWITERVNKIPEPEPDEYHVSESYYNPETLTKTTYNFSATGVFIGTVKEIYDPDKGVVKKEKYTKDGALADVSENAADFNYLEYYSRPRAKRGYHRNYRALRNGEYSRPTTFKPTGFASAAADPQLAAQGLSIYNTVGDRIRRTMDSTRIGSIRQSPTHDPLKFKQARITKDNFRMPSFYRALYSLSYRPRVEFNVDKVTNRAMFKDSFRYFRDTML